MKFRSIITLFLPGLFLMATVETAHGEFLTDLTIDVTQSGGGLFGYEYTLENLPSSDAFAIAFRVDVVAEANLQSLSAPTGWTVFYSPGDTFVVWESSDIPFDIAPGSMGTFGFTSALGPGSQNYAALGFDGNSFPATQGQILAPTAVPEPSTLTLVGIGVIGLIGYSRHCRRVMRRSPATA